MICYLIRHGKDDNTIRGGWSQHPLSPEGIQETEILAQAIASKLKIHKIYSSDLTRAIQTSELIANHIHLDVITVPGFRETNNGDLAGMKNSLALEKYPGLFWNQLKWDQCYPNGESPKQFYERIKNTWETFTKQIISEKKNVALVTHGGVIQVILSIIHHTQYTNTAQNRKIPHGSIITLEYTGDDWREFDRDT